MIYYFAKERGRHTSSISGFSLLELLIVVGIILVIATIAVPSFLRARQAANESAAASSLHSINVAENVYLMTNHLFGTMDQLIADGLLDSRFQDTLSGYNYILALPADNLNYVATAAAANSNNGRFDYYSVPDYVIRYSTEASRAPAGLTGQPVQ